MVEITFAVDPKDGRFAALMQAFGTSQLRAEIAAAMDSVILARWQRPVSGQPKS
jgi:hypothetical protein